MITVVIPTRNRPELVDRAARSVLSQSGVETELIVVDDGSTDGSLEQLRGMEERDKAVIVLAQEKRGAGAARNTGAAAATGEVLLFLDSDDELLPGALENLNDQFSDHNIGAVCASAQLCDQHGRQKHVSRPRPLGPAYENARGLFLAGTFAVRRRIFLAIGGFAERCRSSQHTEFSLRLAPYLHEHHLQLAATDDPAVKVYQHGGAHLRGDLDNLLEGALYIVRNHQRQLMKSPKHYSDWCSVAAVYAAKQRRFSLARSLLCKGVTAYPQKGANYARLLLACCPPLARRVWRAETIV